MSLFQVTERLSRRYGVFSLVDAISMSDNFLRKLFLTGYLLPWPDVGRSLLVFCVVYFAFKNALNTSFVYHAARKRIRSRPPMGGQRLEGPVPPKDGEENGEDQDPPLAGC